MPQTITRTAKDMVNEAVAAMVAMETSLSAVVNLAGGIGAWKKAGGKLE